jgi:hypothetical protein
MESENSIYCSESKEIQFKANNNVDNSCCCQCTKMLREKLKKGKLTLATFSYQPKRWDF